MKTFDSPESILGKTFDCQCGRSHKVPVKTIIYDNDAITRMPGILEAEVPGRTATMISDKRTEDVAGAEVAAALGKAGWTVERVVLPDEGDKPPKCDDLTLNMLKSGTGTPDLFVAVGSGVVNDLTKWLSFEKNTPYTVFATAGTMNGYTSANVAPAIDGVKQIVFAHTPVAVFAQPKIIEGAPFNLIASGLGDVVAKSVSGADWKMNHFLFGEYFCKFCSEIISKIEPLYFDHPDRVANRDPQGIKAIFDALNFSGLAMTMIGTSAPASGGEHLFSHVLDMISSVDGKPHDLHGRQVGLGTIFSAALYERLKEIETPQFVDLPESIDGAFWQRLTKPVAEQYAAKKPHLKEMKDKLIVPSEWQRFKDVVLMDVIPPKKLADCLQTAGAARFVDDIRCTPERAKSAILHMHEMRKRCTVVDLAWMTGIMPNAVDEIMEQWLLN